MVADLCNRFYLSTTRYTTSGFLRVKLGDALSRRRVATHIYATRSDAPAHLPDDSPPAWGRRPQPEGWRKIYPIVWVATGVIS
jgi:hypothetical protein